jgi:hypothetical protein
MSQKQNIQLPEGSLSKETTTINLGPTHPATHGVFQNIFGNGWRTHIRGCANCGLHP